MAHGFKDWTRVLFLIRISSAVEWAMHGSKHVHRRSERNMHLARTGVHSLAIDKEAVMISLNHFVKSIIVDRPLLLCIHQLP